MKKVLKKKRKLNYTRVFSLVFVLIFIISLFNSFNVFALDIPFKLDNVTISEKSDGIEGNVLEYKDGEIKSNIVFHKLNDYVNYKLSLKNNLDKDITILSITDDSDNQYIVYEYDKNENKVIKSNNTFLFNIKAVYKNELTDLSKKDQSSNVKFIIKYLENEKVKETTFTINPNTFDSISNNFILLFISSCGLIVCIFLDKKTKRKRFSKSSIFIITLLMISPIIASASEYNYTIKIISDYTINDKVVVTYSIDGLENTLLNNYNKPITELDIPEKDGYTFTKWTDENGNDVDLNDPIITDLKIFANFSKDTYTINYVLDGGVVLPENPTEYSITDSIRLIEPVKPFYIFNGWTGTDLVTPTKNVVIENKTGNRSYTANYIPEEYTISYTGLTNEEIAILNNPTSYNIETNTFRLNNPSNREDSDGDITEIFVGWRESNTTSLDVSLPNANTMGNKTFEAVWTAADENNYTITYNLNGGTLSEENRTSFTKKTETFTLNNPSKIGYTFKGWSGTDLDGEENTLVKVEKGTRKNLEFSANYTANSYTIKFDKNGTDVTGEMLNQVFTYDTASKLNINTYSRVGYTFDGWNTKADGTGDSYSDQEEILNLISEGELTLFAKWKKKSYTVTIVSNNSSNTPSSLSVEYGSTNSFNLVPNSNYYLKSYSCTNGYKVNNLTTGTSAKNSQTVTINNNGVDGDSTCTFVLSNKLLLYDVTSVGQYVYYKPTSTSFTPDSLYGISGTINPSLTTSWRVLSKNSDGTIDLIPSATSGTLSYGIEGYGAENTTYSYYEEGLQNLSDSFINSLYVKSARPVSESDFTAIKSKGLTISQTYAVNKQDYTSQSWTGNQEGGANWDYYIYYANIATLEKFNVWDKYAGTGGQSSTGYSMDIGVRPIITIKANIYEDGGSGTSSSPWKMTT